MIKIYIFADSYKYFKEAIEEYEKRLWKTLEIVKLKPSKNKEDFLLVREETALVKEKIKKERWYKIVLSPLWKTLDTNSFYDLLEEKKQDFSQIIFVIWWANWLDYSMLKDSIDLELSLSWFTMPHFLALVVLLEQIYRTEMIKKGTDYNK